MSAENLHRRLRLRKEYTAEVNAAARGAFEGGAEAVTIWDSHGRGDCIIVEELDRRVELITGDYQRAPSLPFFDDGYDAGMYLRPRHGGHALRLPAALARCSATARSTAR